MKYNVPAMRRTSFKINYFYVLFVGDSVKFGLDVSFNKI
jgi:hypothetical protein